MHEIEPYYKWRDDYIAAEDDKSPFYETQYNEFSFDKKIYNFLIHPQWDYFGSDTLYIKVIFVDYDLNYAIIELIGEWNDAIENDIMTLKREVIDIFIRHGINRFIIIAENVLNFHSSDDSYYEEWFDDIKEQNGWIVILNMPKATQHDFLRARLNNYVDLLDFVPWRTIKPDLLFNQIDSVFSRRLK